MHGTRILVIGENDPNKVIEHSLSLSGLCDKIDPSNVPRDFLFYSSYCYAGAIWKAVEAGTLLIFLAFKGDDAVAIATLRREKSDDEWKVGFEACLTGHDDAKTDSTHIRSKYFTKQPIATIVG